MNQTILPIILALVFIFLIGKIIDCYIKKIRELLYNGEKGADDKQIERLKKALVVPDKELIPNQYLGFGERVLFFIAFSSSQYLLIVGVWLSFKLASKWQTWSSVIKMPEDLNLTGNNNKDQDQKKGQKQEQDPLKEFEIRNRFGTNLLQRWLIGTLANLLLGYLASVVANITRSLLTDFFCNPFFVFLLF